MKHNKKVFLLFKQVVEELEMKMEYHQLIEFYKAWYRRMSEEHVDDELMDLLELEEIKDGLPILFGEWWDSKPSFG